MGDRRWSKKHNYGPGFVFGGIRRFNYVCFDCRYTSREGSTCPTCGSKLLNAWDKWRVPRKSDDAGWAEYQKQTLAIKDVYHNAWGSENWRQTQAQRLLNKWRSK